MYIVVQMYVDVQIFFTGFYCTLSSLDEGLLMPNREEFELMVCDKHRLKLINDTQEANLFTQAPMTTHTLKNIASSDEYFLQL